MYRKFHTFTLILHQIQYKPIEREVFCTALHPVYSELGYSERYFLYVHCNWDEV
jgi:hypothetical protein